MISADSRYFLAAQDLHPKLDRQKTSFFQLFDVFLQFPYSIWVDFGYFGAPAGSIIAPYFEPSGF